MNKRLVLGFLLLFVVYQASEGMQTVFATGNPLGPTLMVLALALAWPVGRWIDGSGWRAFGLHGRGWIGILGMLPKTYRVLFRRKVPRLAGAPADRSRSA